ERAELPQGERGAMIGRAGGEPPPRLHELAATHGLTVNRISIRNQRWRWGSCNRTGHICLNWRLVTMPEWVRDYVLIHELMHLKRMDHSPRFWKLVAAACPNYQEARRWLRRTDRVGAGENAARALRVPDVRAHRRFTRRWKGRALHRCGRRAKNERQPQSPPGRSRYRCRPAAFHGCLAAD